MVTTEIFPDNVLESLCLIQHVKTMFKQPYPTKIVFSEHNQRQLNCKWSLRSLNIWDSRVPQRWDQIRLHRFHGAELRALGGRLGPLLPWSAAGLGWWPWAMGMPWLWMVLMFEAIPSPQKYDIPLWPLQILWDSTEVQVFCRGLRV